jgi:hypothetical protein
LQKSVSVPEISETAFLIAEHFPSEKFTKHVSADLKMQVTSVLKIPPKDIKKHDSRICAFENEFLSIIFSGGGCIFTAAYLLFLNQHYMIHFQSRKFNL